MTNRTALVTGASARVGRAIALELAESGFDVAIHYRSSSERAREVADACKRAGSDAWIVQANLEDPQQIDEMVAAVLARWPRLDVLVNNAGLGRFDAVTDLSMDAWDSQVDLNLTGVFRATRLAVPLMLEGESGGIVKGHIVNVASIAGLIGNPGLSAYNATKFGVRGFSEATMKELRPRGIRVTCVYPGSIDTEFAAAAGREGNPNAMTAESVAASVLHAVEAPAGTLVSEIVMRPMQVG